jgi:diguanylate cyclase (GGDEF)-like protein/PAS domain S-box-containing protein
LRLLHAFLLSLMCLVASPAAALDAINVPLDVEALDLTRAVDRFVEVGDRIQVSTAPGLDGIVRRIEVRAREADGTGSWVVFALTNTSNEQIDRLLVAPHFRLANSKIIWPDLGASRLVAISPSQGLAPERLESQEADVFRITLDPGAVVTYVVELRTPGLPQLVLWDDDAYRDSVNATTLYKGIVLGISGLLALFLTILFIVKRSAMFPAVAGVAWAVLAYLAIEFGFWNQIFDLQPGEEQVSRAIAEVVLAASLVLLLYAYLSLGAVHSAFFRIGLIWAAFFSSLIGLAIFDPQIAAGIARMGLGVIGIGGLLVIVPMSLQGYDRAVHLIPSWTVFMAWLLAAWLAVSGNIVNDLVSPALAGGLVLLVLLLGFTVMQHAFAGGTLAEGLVSDSERKVLALSGSGDLVWDWDLAKDRVYSSPATEDILGLKRGSLAGPFQDWISAIHPGERDHFRHVVEMVVETGRGRIDQTLRMRAEDGHFKWFRLRARPVVADEGVFRLIGTMLDVTEMKTTQERLLRDAIHDSLTGLPNRELFLDRTQTALERARAEDVARPTLVVVNIDHFSQHNEAVGTSAADSLLTMVARRIDRLLKPNDTLARFSGDQFGILLLSEQKPASVARLTEQIRRALKTPVVFGEDEVNLTVSIGVATYDPNSDGAEDCLRDAEIAMAHAKRLGGDRCEAFRPSLREHGRSIAAVEADLRKALDNDELTVFYQPIIRLEDRRLAGFEALLRWDHPRHGRMAPAEFVPIAERSGLIIPVGLFVLERAARDLNRWMRNDPNAAGLFTSVNISSRQLLRHDLLNDLRAILARADLPGSALKLELTESLVMENPEYASQVLARCRELGIGLSLDDFGTGYSSLAYLQRFPFDTIKIDQSFVAEMEPGEPAVVLAAIVALGHDLEMDIVAEGIESEEVAVELAKLGCEYGQGFQFGHPIPASGVPTFLRSFGQEIALQKQAESQPAPKAIGQPAPPKAQTVVPPLPPTGADRQVSAAPVTPAPSRSERRPAQQRPEPRRTALPIDQTVSPAAMRVEKPEIKPAEPLRPKKPSKDEGEADAIVIEHDANEPAAEPPVRSSKTSRDKAGAKTEAQTGAKTEEQDAKHKASNGGGSHQKPEPADDDLLAASSDSEPAKASMPKPPTRPRSSELDRYRESSARSGTIGTPKPLLPVWNPTGTNGAASSDDGADDGKKDDASPAEASAAETAVERQAGAK